MAKQWQRTRLQLDLLGIMCSWNWLAQSSMPKECIKKTCRNLLLLKLHSFIHYKTLLKKSILKRCRRKLVSYFPLRFLVFFFQVTTFTCLSLRIYGQRGLFYLVWYRRVYITKYLCLFATLYCAYRSLCFCFTLCQLHLYFCILLTKKVLN